ncbi:MAG: transmission trait enhancer LetE [Legionellaceae bacterium]|nr:transmission trait enhancer LetE [Legionellaceae bacterium]
MSDTKALLPHVKLRFNIEHPTVEESYRFGYECALADVTEEDNPFALGSREGEHWNDGWWAGFYGEEPLFTKEPAVDVNSSANDHFYNDSKENLLSKFLEISGVLVVSAIFGYQLFEMVA